MKKKRALVTAATSSIGKVIAAVLNAEGYELVLHYNSNKVLAEKLAKDLGTTLISADLTDKNKAQVFINKLLSEEKFDVIINNAGLSKSSSGKDLEGWERVFRINTVVPALIMGSAHGLVKDDGVIINVSSVYGHERFGDKTLEAYSASKAALNSLTRTFAKKLAPRIRVNAVAPGYVASKWNEEYTSEERKRIEKEQLIERLIDPQEVADLVVHIINNKALDGEVVYIDGGITLKTI